MARFELSDQPHAVVITIPDTLGPDDLQAAKEAFDTHLAEPRSRYVLDCTRVDVWDHRLLRLASRFCIGLKQKGIAVHTLLGQPELVKELRAQGLDGAFNPSSAPTPSVLLAELGVIKAEPEGASRAASKTLDVAFINPFIDGATKTLEIQASIQSTAGKPHLWSKAAPFDAAVVGEIVLQSQRFSGVIRLLFSQSLIFEVCAKILGERPAKVDVTVEDAVKELLNITFGQAKAILNDQGGQSIQSAIPRVVTLADTVAANQKNPGTLVVPFTTEFGDYRIEVCTGVLGGP